MVSINYATREVNCKIVYYGPGLSGKTTNLIYVHEKVPSSTKGKLISLATEADRTLYFDFLPINIGQINGFTAKFQLYTVPGQVYYNATRKLVLRGVDGLVFVADSQPDKMDENIESLTNLKENLAEYGYDYKELPIVIQYNKRDLPGVLPIDALEAKLNPDKWKYFEGEAVSGGGVFDTLKMIIKLVLAKAQSPSTGKSQKLSEVSSGAPAPRPDAQIPSTAASTSETGENRPLEPAISSADKTSSITSPIGRPVPIAATAVPDEQPVLTRQEAYRSDIRQEPGLVSLPDEKESTIQDTNTANAVMQKVAVESGSPDSDRPFPGSSTSRISRRERRITVSDFQPAPRSQQYPVNDNIGTEDKNDNTEIESIMPKPTMAPSTRVVKKKRGLFKRLFGIK